MTSIAWTRAGGKVETVPQVNALAILDDIGGVEDHVTTGRGMVGIVERDEGLSAVIYGVDRLAHDALDGIDDAAGAHVLNDDAGHGLPSLLLATTQGV
jgi:hypothetical protein